MGKPLTYSITNKAAALFFLILLGCTGKTKQDDSVSTQEGNLVEKIKLLTMDGKPINLNDYRGKTVFLNFWATWCRPCIEEMPSIEQASTQLKDANIEFFVASNEEVERIQNFIKKRKLDLNYIRLENLEELNIQSLPTTYIIDAGGNLVFAEAGYRKWDDPANIEMITNIIKNHD